MKNLRITNRKGQVASTITWIVGFLIIFFIMVLFIVFAGVASKDKKVDIKVEVPEKIGYTEYSELSRSFIDFLNNEYKEHDSFKGLIKNWVDIPYGGENSGEFRADIETGFYSFSNKDGIDCFYYFIESEKDNIKGDNFAPPRTVDFYLVSERDKLVELRIGIC